MNPVGEIDHARALGKIEHVAFGREDENFLGEKIVANGGEKFLRIFQILLPFDQPPQPRETLGIALLGRHPLLVGPMRRDSFLGHPMHFAGTNLHFHPLPARPDHGRVERLVHVGLGQRDVVLEAAGTGFQFACTTPSAS